MRKYITTTTDNTNEDIKIGEKESMRYLMREKTIASAFSKNQRKTGI